MIEFPVCRSDLSAFAALEEPPACGCQDSRSPFNGSLVFVRSCACVDVCVLCVCVSVCVFLHGLVWLCSVFS